ncbi:hypothetical protein DFP72DRAFT_830191 [Ephemerocybe angulata]|uniref:Uncharacterized protein n=1 Tax=Ephemerocybe angulata TaxID=980116 RepID=A0A8H6LVV3_9AGAR|nr:hypothetical protein DFP72DRAFT_830191 [Tulosesus angulatus]
MFFLGQLTLGKYPAPSDIHPSTQTRYGPSPNVQHRVGQDLSKHVHHKAVPVPPTSPPFHSPEATTLFDQSLAQAIASGEIPAGFLLLNGERDGFVYPTTESIKIARKYVDVALPFELWYPRAVLWAQGLRIMTLVQDSYE